MYTKLINKPFEIEQCTAEPQHKPLHGHTFFELLFIESGEGIQQINDYSLDYTGGDFFFITPNDRHSFEVHKDSRFTSIRFTKFHFTGKGLVDYKPWFSKLEYIYQANLNSRAQLVLNWQDKSDIGVLMEQVIREHNRPGMLSEDIIKGNIFTILNLVVRNILMSKRADLQGQQDFRVVDIVNYIQLNIYDQALLKVSAIAEAANLAKNYVGDFFKKHTGVSLQEYISDYKLMLAGLKLQHTDMGIKAIAYELGYTDDKHLNKAFHKKYQVSPTQYRRDAQSTIVAPLA